MALEHAEHGAEIARLHRIRCAWHLGDFERAVQLYRARPIEGLDHTVLASTLPWWEDLRLRMELAVGEIERSVSRLLQLQRRDESSSRIGTALKARRLYLLALSYEASGDIRRADSTYRRLLRNFPGSESASRVAPRYAAMQWSEEEQLERALNARSERNYVASTAILRSVVCQDPGCEAWLPSWQDEPHKYEAAWQLAYLLYRYRREHAATALPWLRLMSDKPGPRQLDALQTLAQVYRRLQWHEEARRVWLQLAEYRAGTNDAINDSFFATMALFEDGRWEEASQALAAWVERYPRSVYSREARWWLGWTHYELDECEEAIEIWRGEQLPASPPFLRQQRRYWSAVCAHKLGNTGSARRHWTELAETAHLDWYGALAMQRLNESLPAAVEGDRQLLDSSARTPWFPLARHGFHAEADLLLNMPDSWSNSPHMRLVWRSAVLGDHEEWRTYARTRGRVLPRAPGSEPELLSMQLRYPPMYGPLVSETAANYQIPSAALWALMMQESALDPRAISESDAMGLMQVIPQTAYAIARRLGEGYSDGMLFEPRHALRYGSWYLAALIDEFHGQLPIALLAYNAGPVVVKEWLLNHAGRPLDEFVELITWQQARNYVRIVTENALRYEMAWSERARSGEIDLRTYFPQQVRGEPNDRIPF